MNIDEFKNTFDSEINEIKSIISSLKQGRIKELTGADYDGYLSKNVDNLEKKFSELIYKVVDDRPSNNDIISQLFED